MLPDELKPWLAQAKDIHRRVPVIAPYFEFYGYDSLFKQSGGVQCDLEKLDAAGVRTFGCAVANGGPSYFQISANEYEIAGPAEWVLEALRRKFEEAMALVRSCPRVRIVSTARDLAPDPLGGKIGIIPHITCHSWMVNLEAIDDMFRRGLRVNHPGGSTCTLWCRSHDGARMKIQGRTAPIFNDYGRQVVARMNELGMVIALAHLCDESAEAIIRGSKKPVIDGHTGSRTAVPRSRGLSDRILKMIADSGGCAGIHFADHLFTAKVWDTKYARELAKPATEPPLWAYNRHLLATVSDPDERCRLRKDRAAQQRFFAEHGLKPEPAAPTTRVATLADMAEHVEHMVKVMGVDHVGLGGDVNGITPDSWALGMDHVGELPHLTAELLRRGWREDDLEKFLSRNWRRVFADVLPAGGK